MARPIKEGLDYFPLDVDIFDDPKILFVADRFDSKGEIITIKLLCWIYRNGYYCQWNDEHALIFAKKNFSSIKAGLCQDVVSELLKRDFFNEDIFKSFGILTSKAIQKRWQNVIDRSRRKAEIKDELNLLIHEETPPEQTETPPEKEGSSQSKENKSKEKYSIGCPDPWKEEKEISHTSFVDRFNELYGREGNRALRVTEKKRKMIRGRLRTFTGEEILTAWENRLENDWLLTEGNQYMDDWTSAMRNDEKIERYLTEQESQSDGYGVYREINSN